MSYSQADEYDRRMHARAIEYQRRVDAVVVDPAEQETEYIVECAKELIVNREMAAEAVIAAAARAEAYAVMSAECEAHIAARRVQEGWEPLDRVTLIDDDDENVMAPAGPEPPEPQWQRTPLQEQAHALFLEYESNQRGHTRSRSAARFYKTEADFERELLMERAERNLAAGVVDNEESPFF